MNPGKMKTSLLCISFIVAVSAFPRSQYDQQFNRMYVDRLIQSTWDITPRIMNGVEAVPNSIPYQAYFTVLNGDGSIWFCGGSLISPNFVLTAAHCFNETVSATVLLGAHNIVQQESSRITINSTNFIIHEDYDEQTMTNDIGLIRFDEPVELNENISVVQLPCRENPSDYEGVSARVSGWGQTAGDEDNSPVLRWVNSTVLSNSECNQTYSIVDSQVCISGNGGVGPCFGDSGGPLVYNNIEIGIASFGPAGCAPNFPSGFTRISAFLDWIESQTGLRF